MFSFGFVVRARKVLGYIGVFLIATLFLGTIELLVQPKTSDQVHFQGLASDSMMQCMPSAQLKKTPLQSLFYLHKQPPLLDAVRAAIAQFLPADKSLSRRMDLSMYRWWLLLYAAMATLLFGWIRTLSNGWFAFVATLVWILHPAPIMMATLLEGSFLSSLLVSLVLFQVWRISHKRGSPVLLAFLTVALFLTRTVYQWYFFPVMIVALLLLRVPRRRVAIFAAIAALFVVPYVAKQKVLFGTTSSTTFTGDHSAGIIWYHPPASEIKAIRAEMKLSYPPAADRYSGKDAYNTRAQYEENVIFGQAFSRRLRSAPLESLKMIGKSVALNFSHLWRPTASYFGGNLVVSTIPWTPAYNYVFSGWRFQSLMGFAFLSWGVRLVRSRRVLASARRIAALGLLIGYTLSILHLCNRYEWTEAERLKFFLEPVAFVFLTSEVFQSTRALLRRLRARNSRKKHARPTSLPAMQES